MADDYRKFSTAEGDELNKQPEVAILPNTNGNGYSNKNYEGSTENIIMEETDSKFTSESGELSEKEGEINGRSTRRGFLCCKPKGPPQEEVERVGFFGLFRFADGLDIVLMLVGTLAMMGIGVAIPTNLYFFGDLMTDLVVFDMTDRAGGMSMANASNVSTDRILSECALKRINQISEGGDRISSEQILDLILNRYVIAFVSIGCATFFVAYVGMTFWVWTGNRQIRKVRTAYFEAVMKQSIGWFDVRDTGELNSRMVEDMERLNDGFGDKMATFIQWFSTFLGGYAIGFATGWKLTLVVMAAAPLLVIVAAVLGRFMMTLVRRELQAYAKAGSVAEETFSSIRTVAAFGGEEKAEEKYSFSLGDAMKEGIRKATVGGATGGVFWLLIFCIFALAFWYGAKLTRDDCLDPGAILQVFFGVLIGSMSLGHAAPLLENFSNARAAAALLFKTIDDTVDIDSSSDEGIKSEKLEGSIEFVNVGFRYPARPEVKVLNGLNLRVKKGETVALVGESGCGKSTTIQLLQRFYECESGQVLIDGKNLKEYNLTSLRNHMGIVSQEPVLFATTIGENIKLGGRWGEEITYEAVEDAAKQANCYDFISKLPKKFDTLVGERGVQLSGGQKQRIAIARALVRNPDILLLDEATSALDTQSEAVVQETLDKASEGRTTIVIAHRLSTVKSANKIFAFRDGQVHEEGTHDELMVKEGVYYSLVMRQLERLKEEEREHRKESYMRQMSATSAHSNTLTVPGSPDKVTTCLATPTLARKSSLKRKGSVRSIRSFKEMAHDGYILGMAQSDNTDETELEIDDDDLELEEGQVVARRLLSQEEPEEATISMWEIMKLNKPEWHLIAIGSVAACVSGVIQPSFAILMSEIVGALSEPDPEKQKANVANFVGFILLVGFVSAIATITQNALFALSGERMTLRLRKQSFATIVKQEIAYFDDEKNSVGHLTSRLASDASLVKGATGMRIGILIQSFSTIGAALIVAFYFVWELTLVMLIFMPIMIVAGKIQASLLRGYSKRDKESVEEGGRMAQEAISNMRTVTSMNRQRYFVHKFYQHFKDLYKKDIKMSFIYGIAFSLSQSMTFFMYAICFGFGGYLIVCDCQPWRSERIPFFHILRVFAATTFGSMAVGRTTSQLPDFTKAKLAAFHIKKLLGRKSAIDPTDTTGVEPTECKGDITFTDVEFAYPTRKGVQVLQGLTFQIQKGQTLALVGSSGCGKSTSVSLLERFYEAPAGLVAIDGNSVTALNLKWLRKHIGIVSQEPTLLDTSIADNIAYGDNSREVTISEIKEAAVKANAHNFISQLPQGYETNVGTKGTQLSGGQKQRIAIARALVRDPAILLLDEATSALDTESEKIVQAALDEAMKGRTAIVIAHRLSTIRNADKIGVIDSGKLVEIGTHQELIAKKGFYYNLINAQL